MTLKFKTNINCASCVRTVSGFLNDIDGIAWSVDTSVPEKTLVIEADNPNKQAIIEAVEDAGFDIEELENS
jgi:copper chaperone CopZ